MDAKLLKDADHLKFFILKFILRVKGNALLIWQVQLQCY